MATQAQRLAVAKFRSEKCDRIAADVPKGKREVYRTAAKELQISLASLIQNGVEEYIQNHAGEVVAVKPENQLSAADKKLLENFNSLSPKRQKVLRDIISELVDTKEGEEKPL